MNSRLLRLEGELRKQQQQYDRMHEDSVENAKAIKSYLGQVHEMVTDLNRQQGSSSSTSTQKKPRMTTLSRAARKGDLKIQVHTPEVCPVGEIVLIGGQGRTTKASRQNYCFVCRLITQSFQSIIPIIHINQSNNQSFLTAVLDHTGNRWRP